jgi:hypothetical protein
LNKVIFLAVFLLLFASALSAQQNMEKVTYSYGTSALFVGIMAALWATRTGRSGWLWFFFGWLLAPIACLVAILKNIDDKKKA